MKHAVRSILASVMALLLTAPVLAAGDTKPRKEPSAAQLAARERQSKCSAEWKEAKASGKIAAGKKWPTFWSECNTRLKDQKV